jgi:hypothetical protein
MAAGGWAMVRTALSAMAPGRLRMTTRSQRLYGNQTVTAKLPPGLPMMLGQEAHDHDGYAV